MTILLPIGMTGIRQLRDLVLLQQVRNHIEQVLPASYVCLDPVSLGMGQPKFDFSITASAIEERFSSKLPSNLRERLALKGIEFGQKDLPLESGHWMGNDQPQYIPVITIYAEFASYNNRKINLKYAIEFMIN